MALDVRFECDPRKAATNLSKHGVSFDEALTVFSDPLSFTLPDPLHSHDEDRFITVGLSARNRLLFVVYTDVAPASGVIGARLATATERQQHEEVS